MLYFQVKGVDALRNPERINEVIIEFHKLWQQYPDMRFGQLIECVIVKFHDNRTSVMGVESNLWEWEEVHWLKAIKEYSKK